MASAIRIDNITKSYRLYPKPVDRLKESLNPFRKKYHRNFYALRNVSLDIAQGEFIGIVGKNGSGKSTLLKIIAGVLTPTAGAIRIDGTVSALLELGGGFNPEYTGLENIYLNGAIKGFQKKEIQAKLDEILAFADIGDFVHQPVKIYSSGMLMRLAFSIAIMVDPDILIVDEALSVGDALFQRKCFAKINGFVEAGKTILFVSHSIETVTQLCTRAVLLDGGEVILDAAPKLVRGYYLQLLYAGAGEHEKTRKDILAINADPVLKSGLEKQRADRQPEPATGESDEKNDTIDKKAMKKDFYIENFISQSMSVMKKSDVDIEDVRLANEGDEIVNNISTNDRYVFSFRVRFNVAAEKVTFGMILRTVTGVTISNAQAPGKYPFQYVNRIETGEQHLVSWRFTCRLLPGTYCVNAVVSGAVGVQERGILCRIVDACLFKVHDAPNSKFGGIVHLDQAATISRMGK